MKFIETKIKGLYVIEPEPRIDERGYLMRVFCEDELKKQGINFKIVQASQTLTKEKNTLRGMHFQTGPKAEDKIVRCTRGKVFDVAIDLRQNSTTFGQWVGEELSEDNKKMFLIPKGFAHGFQTLTDNCELLYFMSEFYSGEHASGVRFDDTLFNITWPLSNPFTAEKDKNWPLTTL